MQSFIQIVATAASLINPFSYQTHSEDISNYAQGIIMRIQEQSKNSSQEKRSDPSLLIEAVTKHPHLFELPHKRPLYKIDAYAIPDEKLPEPTFLCDLCQKCPVECLSAFAAWALSTTFTDEHGRLKPRSVALYDCQGWTIFHWLNFLQKENSLSYLHWYLFSRDNKPETAYLKNNARQFCSREDMNGKTALYYGLRSPHPVIMKWWTQTALSTCMAKEKKECDVSLDLKKDFDLLVSHLKERLVKYLLEEDSHQNIISDFYARIEAIEESWIAVVNEVLHLTLSHRIKAQEEAQKSSLPALLIEGIEKDNSCTLMVTSYSQSKNPYTDYAFYACLEALGQDIKERLRDDIQAYTLINDLCNVFKTYSERLICFHESSYSNILKSLCEFMERNIKKDNKESLRTYAPVLLALYGRRLAYYAKPPYTPQDWLAKEDLRKTLLLLHSHPLLQKAADDFKSFASALAGESSILKTLKSHPLTAQKYKDA